MPPGIYDLFSLAMTNFPLRHDRATYVDVAQSSEAKAEQFMIHRSSCIAIVQLHRSANKSADSRCGGHCRCAPKRHPQGRSDDRRATSLSSDGSKHRQA